MDLAVTRIGETVFVGIRHGGNVRLTKADALALAATITELAGETPHAHP